MSGKANISESLAKGLSILDLFGIEDAGYTLSEIAARVGISKTSAHRYVTTYCEQGYLARDARSGLYRLGVRTLALAQSMIETSELVRGLRPFVDEAAARHAIHIDVALLSRDSIYLVYRRDSADTRAFRSFSYASSLHYLAAGKAAMAFMEPRTLADVMSGLALVPKTDRTITDRAVLEAELAEARELGYARNNEESLPGLIAVGAPLFSLRTGKVVGAVSFDTSTTAYSMQEFERLFAGYLVELAKTISAVVSL